MNNTDVPRENDQELLVLSDEEREKFSKWCYQEGSRAYTMMQRCIAEHRKGIEGFEIPIKALEFELNCFSLIIKILEHEDPADRFKGSEAANKEPEKNNVIVLPGNGGH